MKHQTFPVRPFVSSFANPVWSRPAVNIREAEEGIVLEIAAPGLSKDAFEIRIEDQVLQVKTQKIESKDVDNTKYHRKEFSFGTFSRAFQVPDSIDPEKITANYTNGILTIGLAYKPEVKPVVRSIEVA
ncbi:MAG: Hsp20/alpha crystallin family protein [Saprospiraceae bacterium]